MKIFVFCSLIQNTCFSTCFGMFLNTTFRNITHSYITFISDQKYKCFCYVMCVVVLLRNKRGKTHALQYCHINEHKLNNTFLLAELHREMLVLTQKHQCGNCIDVWLCELIMFGSIRVSQICYNFQCLLASSLLSVGQTIEKNANTQH